MCALATVSCALAALVPAFTGREARLIEHKSWMLCCHGTIAISSDLALASTVGRIVGVDSVLFASMS